MVPFLPSPGIYPCIPASEYHAWDAISSTLIRNFAANPSTCREQFVGSDDAAMGTGIHAFTLQGRDIFNAECLILPPEAEGRSAKAEICRIQHKAVYPHRTLLPPVYGPRRIPAMEVVEAVDASMRCHPKIGDILSGMETEVSLVWIDEVSGATCKARLDVWEAAERTIWDLKKVKKISSLRWDMDAGWRYRLQAAHYLNGAIACNLDPVAFGFIACEAFPPYECRPMYSDPDKTEEAQFEVSRLIRLIQQSRELDYWPNFPPPPGLRDWMEITPDSTIEVI